MLTRITCLNVVNSLESKNELKRRPSCVYDVTVAINDGHMHFRHCYGSEVHTLIIRESYWHMITDRYPIRGVSHWKLELSEYVAGHHAIGV